MQGIFDLRPASETHWDIVSLGEVMLRFDPGDDRIRSAHNFHVSEGGGEYNVARNLSYAFRTRSVIVTALAANPIGRLVEDLMRQGGVDTSNVLWRETDGISSTTRNGLYFMESGFGLRPPTGCSDRGNTAVSQLKPGEIDWKAIFASSGARWFHTGGVFAALSDTTPEVAADAMQAARQTGTVVSYDLNYRESLWASRGGRSAADEVNGHLLPYADVVFGVESFDASLTGYTQEAFRAAADAMHERYPNIRVFASTLRNTYSASKHDVAGVCFVDGQVCESRAWLDVDVLDRVGSGDAFAAGLVFGLMEGKGVDESLEIAVASSVHAMTTRGDCLTATEEEINALVSSANAGPLR